MVMMMTMMIVVVVIREDDNDDKNKEVLQCIGPPPPLSVNGRPRFPRTWRAWLHSYLMPLAASVACSPASLRSPAALLRCACLWLCSSFACSLRPH